MPLTKGRALFGSSLQGLQDLQGLVWRECFRYARLPLYNLELSTEQPMPQIGLGDELDNFIRN